MSVAMPMRVPLNKYETIYFIMNSSATPHWLHQRLTRDVDQIHKISSKLRANSRTKVCSLSFCCISRRERQTQSWYRLVLYRHSCDVATNFPPHNPDSSFPTGNRFSTGTPTFRLVFKVHRTFEADPHKEASDQSKHPRVWLTFLSLTTRLTYQRRLQRRTPTTAQILESHLGNIMKNTCGAVPIHF
jgi:hypothetical protein